jgi:hypothetical protein
MDIERKRRLQIFLTLMDTIHDFGDDGRNKEENCKDVIKKKVLESLIKYFTEACFNEMSILGKQNYEFKIVKDLYESIYYDEMKIPTDYQSKVREIVFDVLKVFYNIKVEVVNQSQTNNIELYQTTRNLLKTEFIKYILDKNRANNKLFCVEAKEIVRICQNDIDELSPLVKTLLVGKFTEYDNQTLFKHNFKHKNISSYFNNSSKISNDYYETYGNNCVHGVNNVDYNISKEDNELLLFDKLGVRKNIIYHVIKSEEYLIDLQELKSDSPKGLTLFLKAFIAKERKDVDYLDKLVLKTLASAFKISCSHFDNQIVRTKKTAKLNPNEFICALYDLKRAMDYLQVKACAVFNKNNVFDNTKVVFVSSDRLSFLYAITNECPSILTKQCDDSNDVKMELYHLIPKTTHQGGMIKTIQPKEIYMRNINMTYEYTIDDNEYTDEKVKLKDVIIKGNKTDFGKFLRQYKELRSEMSYVMYIAYKTVFYFLEL